MTTYPPDTFRVDDLMAHVADTLAAHRADNHAALEQRTHEAIEAALPRVRAVLEDAGLDIFAGLTTGTHPLGAHIGWIKSEHGLEFEVQIGTPDHPDVWVLHPETRERARKIGPYTRWIDVCLAFDELDQATDPIDAEPTSPLDRPEDQFLDALRALIRAVAGDGTSYTEAF